MFNKKFVIRYTGSGKERNTKRNAHVELNVEPDLHKDYDPLGDRSTGFVPSLHISPPQKRKRTGSGGHKVTSVTKYPWSTAEAEE